MHKPDTVKPKHIANLMGVDEHRGCPVRDHGAGKLGDGQHARFHMQMTVAQAGHHVSHAYLNHLGGFANDVGRIRSDKSDPTEVNGDVMPLQHLAEMDVDPSAGGSDHIGGRATHGAI